MLPDEILKVSGLCSYFKTPNGVVKSVDGVDLKLKRGETLAVVGESGSGKSVTSLSILQLLGAGGFNAGGAILYQDKESIRNILELDEGAMRKIRGHEIAMIFQEPMSSLNPLFSIGDQIAEPLIYHKGLTRKAALSVAVDFLNMVEIPDAKNRLNDYPHQLSGGMRQRVMIAIALSCSPSLLIADEPTTALDVTIQAQILDLLRKLQRELNMSILFITHNLGVVAEIAHQVAVMYSGRIVENADVSSIFNKPLHPYTRALLRSTPRLDRDRSVHYSSTRLPSIKGAMPSPYDARSGCDFYSRCDFADADCRAIDANLNVIHPTHSSACTKWTELESLN